jgi:hypothetical protein
MLLSALLTLIDELKPGNKFSSAIKTSWINEVEGQLWNEVYKYKGLQSYSTASNYALPTNTGIEHVKEVYAGTDLMSQIDVGQKETTGYYYDKTLGKIVVYPTTGYTTVDIAYLLPFAPKISTDALSVVSPFDRMFIEYLSAKIDFYSQNYAAYNNEMAAFNQTFQEYSDWWNAKNGGV